MADYMSWKKAVFYGGAVLVLAACDNATAPTSPSAMTKLDGVAAAAKQKATTETAPAPQANPLSLPTVPNTGCAAAVIHVGLDGELIMVCAPVEW